jgi:hypothetical protein
MSAINAISIVPSSTFHFYCTDGFVFLLRAGSICACKFPGVKRRETPNPGKNEGKSRHCCGAATSDWVLYRCFLVFSRLPRFQHHGLRL